MSEDMTPETIPSGPVLWVIDVDWRIYSISPNVQEYFGYTVEEVLGRFADSFIGYSDRARGRDLLLSRAVPGGSWRDERLTFIARDGRMVEMLGSGRALTDTSGAYVGLSGSMRLAPHPAWA
jgi:PAS domain S-box-containing protein